jgi:hypothetical protein
MARNTTATTAFALMSFSAARSTFSPVADHQVMAEPAILVTDNAELAGLVRFYRDDHLVARVNLHVNVDGLQGEAVHPVQR